MTERARHRVSLVALVAGLACLAVACQPWSAAGAARHAPRRSALVMGVVIDVGGPPRPNERDRRTYAEVAVHGVHGRLITTVHATPAGIRLWLLPGRYEFSIDAGPSVAIECKPITVLAKAHSATRVRVTTGCAES